LKSRHNLLWGMALLGLLLLPTGYRAGAESVHSHSLVQVWVDALDGTIRHTHDRQLAPESVIALPTSWLDPLVGDAGSAGPIGVDDERPDVAQQQESAPTTSGVHLLLTIADGFLASGALLTIPIRWERPTTGLPSPIILPPPRWTPNAV
jgi:hypothetical protein